MVRRTTRVLGWMTILMLAAAAPALADSHEAHGSGKQKGHGKSAAAGQSGTGPSAEERAKMAEAHEKLAACLRSTRPIGECHSEMKKAHHGMGHGHDCDCEHGEGQCSEHGSCEGGHHGEGHGEGHGAHGKGKTGKTSKTPAPSSTPAPTTSGPTQ